MTDPVLDLDALPAPRRVAVAGLLDQIHATERALADFYLRFAAHERVPALRVGLEALARAKLEQAERLAPLGQAAGAALEGARADPGGIEPSAPRPEAFLAAFQTERDLEIRYREVTALLLEWEVPAPLLDAAAQASRHRAHLRDLYLAYS
jgi:hypothetical protein